MASKSYISKYMKFLLFFIIFSTYCLYSQDKSYLQKKYSIFPDEYSVLDDVSTPIYTTDQYVLEILQDARKTYIKALVYANKKDSLQAQKFFKKSLEHINELASYPDIVSNSDFTDLALQIMEDYETFANKTDLIDENSPLFLVRDKIFSDIEKELVFKDLKTLKDKKTASTGIVEPKVPVDFTIPMPENEIVKKSIKWFTETSFGRKVFQSWYSKHTRWFPLMKKIALEEGVPVEIVYLSMIESGLNPTAVSKAAAVGLWQFMPDTGKDFGLNDEASIWVDERRDPEKSTRAAMKYLKFLYNEFGDWHLALASYNCGQGRVRRAIRQSGKANPTFWEISDILPKETRYYVPRFISTALVASEPALYNFQVDTFDYHKEYKFDLYELNEPVSIAAIAGCLGVTETEIYALNPEIIRSSTPPGISKYMLKIPSGTKNQFASAFNKLSQDEKQPFVEHNVLNGENIAMIAKKYSVDASVIADLNDLSSSRVKLKRGAKLILPLSITDYEQINDQAKETGTYSPLESTVDLTHYVKRGESLFRIAKKYGVSVDYLAELNNLRSKNSKLTVGQKLIVSIKSQESEDDEDNDENIAETKGVETKNLDRQIVVNHEVRNGESIAEIAKLYNTDVNQIKTDNRLRSNSVRAGRNLKITTLVSPETFKQKQQLEETNQIAFHYVKRGESLGKIASKYGMSVSELQDINNIRRGKIHPGQKLKVQKSEKYESSEINITENTTSTSNAVHKVRRGESLFQIAQKYDLSVDQVKSLNNLSSDYIYAGQNLKVVSNGTLPSANKSMTKHTVRRGETLGYIADNYGVSTQNIRNWNNIKGSKIYPGQKLLVQANSDYTQSSTPKNVDFHRVRKGETLGQIADKYDVTVNQLQAWNNISGTNIQAGEKLVLNSNSLAKGSNSKSSGGNPVYYTLKKGETLNFVANKFSIDLSKVKDLNPNLNERYLQVGQKIRVK